MRLIGVVVALVVFLVFVAGPSSAAPACGDPDGSNSVTATDSLVVLKRAVNQPVSCLDCACDVNADARITATDSLIVLKKAVGSVRALGCFADASCATAQPTLDTLRPLAASPFALLALDGGIFDPAARHSVRLLTANGLALVTPAVGATAATVTAPVAPLMPSATSVQVFEESGDSLAYSNALGGLDIGSMPTAPTVPGTVTSDFLDGAVELGTDILSRLGGTSLDTPALRSAIEQNLAALSALGDEVDAIVSGAAEEFGLGTLGGTVMRVTADDLGAADSAILAMLLAQSGLEESGGQTVAVPFRAAAAAQTAGCGRPDALAYYNDQINGVATTASRPSYFGAGGGCAAEAFNTSFSIVGGAAAIGTGILVLGGAPAIALSLPAAALLYVTIGGSGGMIAVGGALGQTSEDARAIVKAGVAQIESAIQSAVIQQVLPNAAGTLWEMADGAKKLFDAFTGGGGPATTTTMQVSTTTVLSSTTTISTPSGGGNSCWCCCAWWDGCCTEFTCRESANDLSGSLGDSGNCFYYDSSLELCGTGYCESN